MENINQILLIRFLFSVKKKMKLTSVLLLSFLFLSTALIEAQNRRVIKGTILDETNQPLIGATVAIKNIKSSSVITDIDGHFTINVPEDRKTLVVSYIGYITQEVSISGKNSITVVLKDDSKEMGEVVVIGYGQQQKASVVGAITQTTGEVLQRTGGVSNVGAALTGNLPGVVTMSSTGMPGAEDPQIIIRGTSSWNSANPLILVDGVEREMSGIDISSVQSISVLKDASATAVYGVRGANGVILITTKRGSEGRARIDISASTTVKTVSKLPNKYDSYDALSYRNTAIENELTISPSSWTKITPQDIIKKYRYPANITEAERYPNVDWQNELFKQDALSYQCNLNISGGTNFVKYFASADYAHEGDLMKIWDNDRNYKTGYGYDRLNVRSNLDFKLTSSTTLKVNLYGSSAFRKSTGNTNTGNDYYVQQQWAGAYGIAPDVFLPKYSDGSWGYYPNISNVTNSAANTTLAGVNTQITTRITTDFVLEQNLDFITKGLTFRGSLSMDNSFLDTGRGVGDLYNNAKYEWIDPDTGKKIIQQEYDGNNKMDFIQGTLWSTSGGSVQNYATYRQTLYQLQANWSRKFGLHNLSAMGVFTRQENASGSQIPSYRENWAFRATYNYANKYFVDYNGAYNGSEKFAPQNRFAFFQSGALGWMLSEEKFMKRLKFLDMLKLRASYGELGDDAVARFQYLSQWAYGGNSRMDLNTNNSPYTWYRESVVGNSDLHWETVVKQNYGLDYAFLNGLIAGSVDIFKDNRRDIVVGGTDRSVPAYFGQSPVNANLGKAETTGYEFEVRLNKKLANGIRLWVNFNMTHAKNKIIVKDDPALYPSYLKQAGYSIGQYRSYISSGYVNNYDQIYGSVQKNQNDLQKLPGDYYINDFNGDGVIDSKDNVPTGYTGSPQNTYSATIGFDWKGFSAFVQFYGVNNVTRDVSLVNFGSQMDVVYNQGSWWSKGNMNADVTPSRWISTPSYNDGTRYLYDGSFIRLKNAEIGYTFSGRSIKSIGLNSLKLYANGNNLWMWSRMPDDRESNFNGSGSAGAYPTVKRFNLGLRVTL